MIGCSDVVDGEEFASLNCQDVIRIISSDKLTVPSEEKVLNFIKSSFVVVLS